MRSDSGLLRRGRDHGFLTTGLCIGLAGGLAEIGVVLLYSALTGGDAAAVARNVASAVGLDGASAAAGVAIHMGLAAALGVGLSAVMLAMGVTPFRDATVFSLMPAMLAVVWAINFFVVLPVISPGFVHLLPYGVTLASKLTFGLAAAVTSRVVIPRPGHVSAWSRVTP